MLRQREAGDRRPSRFSRRRQRAIGDPRIRARRRLDVFAHPPIEGAEQRAGNRRVVQWIECGAADHAAAARRHWRKGPRSVRRRGHRVNARVRRQRGIARAGRVGVHERSGAVEVLGIGQKVEDLRRGAALLGTRQQAVADTAFRVRLGAVGERKQVDRVKDVEELQRVARGLGKAMVERPASGAADLIEDAVEYFSSLLVLIEALIKKVAEKAAALRHAPGERRTQAGRWVA